MTEFFENGYLQFHTISEQADQAFQSLTPEARGNFLVLAEVLEGALATGRPPTRLMEDIDDDLFVLNGTALGGAERFICACRGRRILLASIIGNGLRMSEREVDAARAALSEWERANCSAA
jgi:hypothetical protein